MTEPAYSPVQWDYNSSLWDSLGKQYKQVQLDMPHKLESAKCRE